MSMKRYAMEFVGTFFLTMAISLIGNPISNWAYVDGDDLCWWSRFWCSF